MLEITAIESAQRERTFTAPRKREPFIGHFRGLVEERARMRRAFPGDRVPFGHQAPAGFAEGPLLAGRRGEALEVDHRLLANLEGVEAVSAIDGEEIGQDLMKRRPPSVGTAEAREVRDERVELVGRAERIAQTDGDRPGGAIGNDAGRLVAFLNEVPGVRAGVATVDLMRHRRESPNGVMDYLFCELMLRLHGEGYRWFSLGLAPLAGVGDRPGASLQERAVHQVYQHLTAVFSFKGLRNYKAKFEPLWEERFLIYQDGPTGLVRTALALGRLSQR